MKTRFAVAILAVVALAASLALAARTARRGFDQTNQESLNRNFQLVDDTSPIFPNIGAKIRLCGQNVNTSTVFLGPAVSTFFGRAAEPLQGDAVCDALESTTEATADNPLNATYPPFAVAGMRCSVSSDPASDVVFTLRSAAADTSPVVTCTVAGTGTGQDCFGSINVPPTIASGATIAVRVVTLEDLSAQDASCDLTIQVRN